MEGLGPELLANGDFEQSVGVGATSVIGPGWASDYAMCGPSIFNSPCGGGTMAYFTTNAGQVTNASNNVIPVIGSRSLAVNVSNSLTADIIRWTNIPLENGQKYRLTVTAAIMGPPFSIAVQINNGLNGTFPVTAPPGLRVWGTTTTDFVFTGPTGNYPVSLNSNSGVLGGNDHTFDNISLRAVVDDEQYPTCCGVTLGSGCLDNGHQWIMVSNEDGTVTVYDAETGLVANPADITDCGQELFVTEHVTVPGPFNNLTGVGVKIYMGSLIGMVSWHVRAVTAGITLVVNGVGVAMDVNEVIASSSQDGRILNDTVQVSAGSAGQTAEIVVVRRA